MNKDEVINQEISNLDVIEGQAAEEINSLARKDYIVLGEEVSQNCCNPEAKQAKGMVFFYLLLPIVLAALYISGVSWFFYYPAYINISQYYDFTFHSIFDALVISTPLYLLYFLSALLRCYFGKPLNGLNKIAWSIVIFSIWAYVCVFFFDESEFVMLLKLLYRNAEPILIVGGILFFMTMFKACYAILGYTKSKRSVNNDLISCTALCVAYIAICSFFIFEGGLIYLVPDNAKYNATTEDFPVDKLAILKSFFKFAGLSGYKRESFFHPDKLISYEDLLTMAAISPTLFSYGYRNYPKFYARYLTNEILYPLSDDLAQKEYWGRKLIVSTERIEDHFYNRKSTMERDIFLARQYLYILSAMASGKPESAYKQWIRDKSPSKSIWGGIEPTLQTTSEEEKEWFYWYKLLWPQIEDVIDSVKNN